MILLLEQEIVLSTKIARKQTQSLEFWPLLIIFLIFNNILSIVDLSFQKHCVNSKDLYKKRHIVGQLWTFFLDSFFVKPYHTRILLINQKLIQVSQLVICLHMKINKASLQKNILFFHRNYGRSKRGGHKCPPPSPRLGMHLRGYGLQG